MLIIIRGLPGSGKTTLAKSFEGYQHFESDKCFMVGDKYEFDPTELSTAHAFCQYDAFCAIKRPTGTNQADCAFDCKVCGDDARAARN